MTLPTADTQINTHILMHIYVYMHTRMNKHATIHIHIHICICVEIRKKDTCFFVIFSFTRTTWCLCVIHWYTSFKPSVEIYSPYSFRLIFSINNQFSQCVLWQNTFVPRAWICDTPYMWGYICFVGTHEWQYCFIGDSHQTLCTGTLYFYNQSNVVLYASHYCCYLPGTLNPMVVGPSLLAP